MSYFNQGRGLNHNTRGRWVPGRGTVTGGPADQFWQQQQQMGGGPPRMGPFTHRPPPIQQTGGDRNRVPTLHLGQREQERHLKQEMAEELGVSAAGSTNNVFAMLVSRQKKRPAAPVVSLDEGPVRSEVVLEDGEISGEAESSGSKEEAKSSPSGSGTNATGELTIGSLPDVVLEDAPVRKRRDLEDGELPDDEDIVCVGEFDKSDKEKGKQSNSDEVICIGETDDSQDDDDVIFMQDLTVIDEAEGSMVEQGTPIKSPRRKKRRTRSSIAFPVGSGHLKQERAVEDSLSKGTIQFHQLDARHWLTLQQTSMKPNLRVCSYNVLCQQTIGTTMYLYGHLKRDQSPLNWENRWNLLAQDFLHIDADVFGLQEVQYDHYDSHYKPYMENLGYVGFYKKRLHNCKDGCAIFFKEAKYEAKNYSIVEYYVAPNTTMDREQIGQILRLQDKATKQDFIVANTHLIFNINRGDIKIGQMAMLLAHINQEMTRGGGKCPLIITGDFNMEPFSYVYTYVSEGKVFLRGLPRNELSGQGGTGGPVVRAADILPPASNVGRDSLFVTDPNHQPVEDDYFTHPFQLSCAYSHSNVNGKRDVSTYHREAANPDCIFYSVKRKNHIGDNTQVFEYPSLRLIRRMSCPDHDLLRSTLGPWPNKHVPSDHIPLVADFCLKARKQK